jgi:hypothetical protein
MLVPAFPPRLSISSPASVANGWDEDTIPFVPYTTDRRLGNRWKTNSGLSTLDQSTLAADKDSETMASSLGSNREHCKRTPVSRFVG